MKQFLFYFFIFCYVIPVLAQEETIVTEIDSLYKEDQFYAGVTYNLIGKKPDNLTQNGFSLGFHVGFIKDMPINTSRTKAIGIGLGYSVNSFNQNLLVNTDETNVYVYELVDKNSFTKNKFSNHLIEVPVEFRWRTSTPTDYNFWRIYAGFKFSYAFAQRTKYKGDLGTIIHSKNDDFNRFQYGLTLSAGYNTWNFYVYYGLNPILSKNATLNGDAIDVNAIKMGLMFYIL